MKDEESTFSPQGTNFPPLSHKSFIKKLIGFRVRDMTDAEDISQEVYKRAWRWATKAEKDLSEQDWKKIVAKIAFNEINRYYSHKQRDLYSNSDIDSVTEDANVGQNLQKILEITYELKALPVRQRLSLLLGKKQVLVFLKTVLSDQHLADLVGVGVETYKKMESEIPLEEEQIRGIIEFVTGKKCRSSIRDERSKGKKRLRERLFGK